MAQGRIGDGDHRRRRLFIFEVSVGIYTVLLVGLSIFLFMINSAADQIENLITSQNSAALTLWSNIDEYKHYLAIDPKANAEATLPPGFVADLVNFSRTNATILETLYRLSYQGVMSSTGKSWSSVKNHLLSPAEVDGTKLPASFDHFGVNPKTNPDDLIYQGIYQIQLYQALRDYAQDQYSFHHNVLGAISMYVLPVLYALLGCFLYTFRKLCKICDENRNQEPNLTFDHVSQFIMAGIAGIAITVFKDFFPKDALLSPLAIAFIVGYSTEIFTSRLDAYVAKYTVQSSARRDGSREAGHPITAPVP
jgi:hypothetical protein